MIKSYFTLVRSPTMNQFRLLHTQSAAQLLGRACATPRVQLPVLSVYSAFRPYSMHRLSLPVLTAQKALAVSQLSSQCITPMHTQTKALSTSAPALMRFGGDRNQNIEPVYSPQTYQSESSDSTDLPEHVRDHLTRTYMLLASGVAGAALGAALMIFTPLCKVVPYWLPMVGAFVPLLWLNFAPPSNPNTKLALFFSFCFLEGMAIAPIVWMSAAKGVLFSALFLTFAVFAGFTAAAFLAPQGKLLAFQGPLFAILIGFVGISFLNLFFPSKFAHSILLYGGLALFSALVAVDTQAMIERARCGMGDHVQDAMGLFINMINIFTRIAQIMGGRD